MHTILLYLLSKSSSTVIAMCSAGILIFVVALWSAKTVIARAGGLDKIVALTNLCFAVPLAIFGALHIAGVEFVVGAVPSYMPWRLFWAYLVGFALLAASLSIATDILVRWSGLLFGMMMFLFVVMQEILGDRFGWTVVIREMGFAAGGWPLAANAMRHQAGSKLVTVSRVLAGITAVFFGVEHFLHPIARPGVPLQQLMPEWIPGRPVIGYLTGALLVVAGVAMVLDKKARLAATYLGTWIVLLVVFIYGPILIASLADPSAGVEIEGINYFADTMLFAGAILALAKATPRAE